MDNSTPIPFDQFQRYGVAARVVEMLRQNSQRFNILEVGANSHKLLGRLLPNDHIIYLDREIPPEMQDQEDIIVGDATELSLPDNSFDIVVALDVFEHIPKKSREAFLNHTCRIAQHLTIIGAPFDFCHVIEAEQDAMNCWHRLFNYSYRWLAEHAENGLPNLDSTIRSVASLGYHFHSLQHGDINLWLAYIKGHFAKEYFEALKPTMRMFDNYYNNHLFKTDFNVLKSYRHFILCSCNAETIKTIKSNFNNENFHVEDKDKIELPLQVLNELPSIASDIYRMTTEHTRMIAEKDQRINAITSSFSWRITRPLRKLIRVMKCQN